MSSKENSDRPDYTPQIRQEVEETVKNLLLRYSGYGQFSRKPEYVELGYLVATHAGKDVFKEGDRVLGIPVKIGRNDPRRLALFPIIERANRASEFIKEIW